VQKVTCKIKYGRSGDEIAKSFENSLISRTNNALFRYLHSEHDFFEEESNFTQFYTAFAALAADKLMQIKTSKCTLMIFRQMKTKQRNVWPRIE